MKKKILLALFLCCLGGASLCAVFHAPEEERTLTVQAEQTLPENAPKNLEELQNAKDEDIKKWAEELKSFSSGDYNLVTSVKNQGSTNICWAYGTVSTAETSILRKGIDPKATKETLNLDAKNAAWAVANRDESTDPLKNALDVYFSNWNVGGGTTAIINVMSQGCIPTQEMTNHFQYGKVKYQLLNAYYIPNDVQAVKEAILRYGAVTVSYTVSNNQNGYKGYFNYDGHGGAGHLCSIVGWDDTAPADSFRPKQAKENGGWIVKNSWGNYSSDVSKKYGGGYFVLSYENSGTGGIHALDFGMKEDYPNIYYYDGGSTYNVNLSDVKDCGAIYQVKKANLNTCEKLKGISLEVTGSATCNVKVYTNLSIVDPSNIQVRSDGTNNPEQGEPAATTEVHFDQKGTYMISLDTPLDLDPGSYFSIVVETSGDGSVASGGDYTSNDLTFYKRDGVWYNYKYQSGNEYAKDGLAARIHAVTKTEKREKPLPYDMCYVRVEFDHAILKYSKDGTYEPKVKAYLGDKLLEETYYTLTYSDNHKPGAATVKLTGKDGYQGEKTEHFLIQKGDLPPNAPERTITVYNHIHYIKDVPLPEGWQWLEYCRNQKLPYEYATAEYKGEDAEYYLRTMVDIRIEYSNGAPDPIDLSDCEITVEGEYTYTGKPICPKPKVIVNGICLTEADYTVSYENNTHHGTATVTVTGRGAYYGTKSATFEIKKAPCPPLEQTLIEVGEDVETLSEVPLPHNWAWKTNEKIGENGGEFTAVYRGADANDYEICERTVVIERIRKQKPAQPEIPTKPDTPDQPDDPEPDTPSEPENPTEPDTPSEPDTPAEPDTPTEPDDPVQPEIPTEPNMPKVPEPERPDPPAEPDDPTPPAEEPKEQPSEPDSPLKDRPSDSEASVKPDHSGSIDTPAAEESKQTNPLLWLLVIPAVLIPAAAVAIIVRKRK